MWLTTKKAAEILGISERAVRKRVKTGKLAGKWVKGERGGRSGRVLLVWIEEPIGEPLRNQPNPLGDKQNKPIAEPIAEPIGEPVDTTSSCNSLGGEGMGKWHLSRERLMPKSDVGEKVALVGLSDGVSKGSAPENRGVKGGLMPTTNAKNGIYPTSRDSRPTFWVPVSEVYEFVGVPYRTLNRWVRSGRYPGRYREGKGRGGKVLEVDLMAFGEEVVREYLYERYGVVRAEDLPRFIEKYRLKVKPGELGNPRRAERIKAVVEFLRRPEGVGGEEWAEIVAGKYGKSKQTLYRWVKEYREGRRVDDEGYKLPGGRVIRTRSIPHEAIAFIVARLKELGRVDMGVRRQIWREVLEISAKRGWGLTAKQEKSYYRVVKEVLEDEAMRLYIIGRGRALERNLLPPILRDMTVYAPAEVYVGDQKVWDWYVIDEVTGEVSRPVSYLWIDMRTGLIVGHVMTLRKYSRWDVGLALKRACLWGVPRQIYTDNGKPELSGYVAEVRKRLSGLVDFVEVGLDEWEGLSGAVGHVKAIPKNAKAKLNERRHGVLDVMLRQRGIPGYAPNRGQEDERERRDKEMLRFLKAGKLLTFSEFYRAVEDVIRAWNETEHVHGDEEIVPIEMFRELVKQQPPVIYDEATLDVMFLWGVKRKVRRAMVEVTVPGLGKLRYHDLKLASWNGKVVDVRLNPYEPEYAYILSEKGEVIAVAEEWGKVNPKDPEQVAERMRRKRMVIKAYREFFEKAREEAKEVWPHFRKKVSRYEQIASEVRRLKERRARITPTEREKERAYEALIQAYLQPAAVSGGKE